MNRVVTTFSVLAAAASMSGQVSAEYFGLVNGRSADLAELPDTSVEVGFMTGDIVFGDWDDGDYQHIGARLNHRLSPEMMLLADIGQSESEDDDGTTFGLGVYYQTQGVFPTTDFTVKGSFHTGDIDTDRDDADVEGIALEGLFSSKDPIGESQLRWYANLGIHRLKIEVGSDSESGTEIGFGGGVFADANAGNGQFYGGIDMIDELTFGVGYRHFLK